MSKVALSDCNLREVAPLELNSSKVAPLEFIWIRLRPRILILVSDVRIYWKKVAHADISLSVVAPVEV